ncbi:Swi snf-related matrix-associated actin-dependent regulator of chromatin subfamily a member 3-like 1 [Lasiodiplodia theobromae]|uniref:Swi snf-related matrix-associated actin-dependent regulator of chromatin subfamily a member 3-like 1 n=1 Tax=Lasiodiplodia theobromae TaxID=45133 RepID=UPI0015C3481E|nr:Swi snf-related matrix-associated actin-dependent regulator of chromatin subfamily a member 3-like 1 [Lasiodiplodia theobromae]KAF4533787.1 Swi snf-related matrix-associated actin-dependent regulator of chromatin subfamily a member 3-like 1 [Lasiodiplodia theobromae]
MSRGGKLKMTFDLPKIQQTHVAKKFQGATDFFANLEAEEDDQADTPQGLRTKLLPHQKRALAFMLRREGGWIYDGSRRDLWTMNQDILGQTFTNNITGHLHKDPPPDFRGGLLADEMGLGKTLSTIALIVSDKDPRMQSAPCSITSAHNQEWSRNATLVIVPSSLLQVWNTQLEQHTYPGRVQWVIYHGPRRLTALCQASQPDIVITTFQTLASEYGHGKSQSSPIFTTHWKRIVLDEAHIIRERITMTAKAIRALSAERRWALTGTPVQNRMTDFASLLEFLRVHPYNDHKAFERDISLPCVDGCGEEGVRRLKTLVGCIVLRRRTTIIQLPPRHDEIRPLEFTPEERDFYDKASSPIKKMLDNALDDYDSSAEVFLGAFQLINRLRKICNLGVSAIPSSSTIASPPPENSWGVSTAQSAFETLLSMDQAKCFNCLQEVESSTDLSTSENLSLPTSLSSRIFRCLKVLCGPCYAQSGCGIACGDSPACPSEAVFTSASAPSTPLASRPEPGSPVSSKVKALVEDVLEHPDEKSVIFSYWTTSLDAVECALEDNRVGYVRFDGQTSSGNRKVALRRLHNDPSVRVMLITVGCGAVGLDLTAASRIYLLEPQWNPTTEDQALARIHRMGQKRPVTTIRFVMKDSFEEHLRSLLG